MANVNVPVINAVNGTQKGLGGSEKTYRVMQVRVPQHGTLRFQSFKQEDDVPVTQELTTYIQTVHHGLKSLAGSGAFYAPVLVRREDDKGSIRVQIPGPKLNRPYGACVVVKAPVVFQWSSLNTLEGV